MCNVIIIGAGGHAKVIADIVIKNGDTLLGFLDDRKTGKVLGDFSVIGTVSSAEQFADVKFLIGIGDNSVRKRIAETLQVSWYTAIHPSAQIGLSVRIGEGTCVMAGAVINSDTQVGKHCIVNSAAVVEHDNSLADYVHVSPNATLCGTVSVGECTHIGAAVCVKNNVRICADVVLGIGACAVKDIAVPGVYVGIPAHKLK